MPGLIIKLALLLIFTMADIISTISKSDLDVAKKCSTSGHPCIIESLDCSAALDFLAHRLSETTAQLLLILNPDYFGNSGSYSVFPGIRTGTLGLRSSSFSDYSTHPEYARYEYTIGGSNNLWEPKDSTSAEYLQATSSIPYYFNKITTRGKTNTGTFIKSFIIQYSLDLATWNDYNNQEILVANTDDNESVENILIPFLAKSIRIYCKSYSNKCSTQLEVYISHPVYSRVVPSGTVVKAVEGGQNALVSGFWDALHEVNKLHLNFIGNQQAYSWCGAFIDEKQWAMVSATKLVKWTRVDTQGRADADYWVANIKISYTVDGVNWVFYKEGLLLSANSDRNTIIVNNLEPFVARAIKIHVIYYNSFPCMRMDAYYEEL
jgi:hypothetical protein